MICFNTWGWGWAPLTETEVSVCSFICVRTEAQSFTRNPLIPKTHVNMLHLDANTQTCLCLAYFVPYLANKAPKHGPRSRIWVLPRSTEVVGKSESWLQPVPSEVHSSRVRASNFPDEASKEPLIPNTRLFSGVSRTKQQQTWLRNSTMSFYFLCNAAGIYEPFLKKKTNPKQEL